MGSGTRAFRKSLATIWRHMKRENESFSHANCLTQVPGKTRCLLAIVGLSVHKAQDKESTALGIGCA